MMRVLTALLLTAILLLAAAPPALGAAGATVGPTPAEVVIGVGETATIEIAVQNAVDLYGIDVRASFDPAVVEVVDAEPDLVVPRLHPLMVQARAGEVAEIDRTPLPPQLLIGLHRREDLKEVLLHPERRLVDRVAGVVVAGDQVHLQVPAVCGQQIQGPAFLLGCPAGEVTEDPQPVPRRQRLDPGEDLPVMHCNLHAPQPGDEAVAQVQVGGEPDGHGVQPIPRPVRPG